MSGAGALTITGPLNWSAGTQTGTGSTTVSSPLSITGVVALDTRTLNNNGLGSMSAGEFVKRVRRAAYGRKPVVLVYTDKANTDEIGSAIIEGAAEFLLKPFDRDLLEFKLKQVGLL